MRVKFNSESGTYVINIKDTKIDLNTEEANTLLRKLEIELLKTPTLFDEKITNYEERRKAK